MVALTIDQGCHPRPYSQCNLVTWSFSDLAKQGYSKTTPCGKVSNMHTQWDCLHWFIYSKTTRPRHPGNWLVKNYSYLSGKPPCALDTIFKLFKNYSKTTQKLLRVTETIPKLLQNYSKTTPCRKNYSETTPKLLRARSRISNYSKTTPCLEFGLGVILGYSNNYSDVFRML